MTYKNYDAGDSELLLKNVFRHIPLDHLIIFINRYFNGENYIDCLDDLFESYRKYVINRLIKLYQANDIHFYIDKKTIKDVFFDSDDGNCHLIFDYSNNILFLNSDNENIQQKIRKKLFTSGLILIEKELVVDRILFSLPVFEAFSFSSFQNPFNPN